MYGPERATKYTGQSVYIDNAVLDEVQLSSYIYQHILHTHTTERCHSEHIAVIAL